LSAASLRKETAANVGVAEMVAGEVHFLGGRPEEQAVEAVEEGMTSGREEPAYA
jgi:hypothetical protein